MISTSATYQSLLANKEARGEWRVTVGGTVYNLLGDKHIPHLSRKLFYGSSPAPGGCEAASFTCTIRPAGGSITRAATVVPAFRLTDGSSTSEWITLGTFFLDVRQPDKASGTLKLECWDSMRKADGDPYKKRTAFTTWPQDMDDVVAEIAGLMGVTVDSRSVIHGGTGYQVEYPNDLTAREVLSYIAAAHGGCFTITHANKLRLVPITGNADTMSVGWKVKALKNPDPLSAYTGVTVYYDDEEAFDAGTDTGRVLEADCPWATQATANGLLSVVQGYSYTPFTATGAIINLAAELGDTIIIGGNGPVLTGTTTAHIFDMEITCVGKGHATVSAPGEAEVDHEYPYTDASNRALKRRVELGKSYYGTTISREKGIEIKRSDGRSRAIFNSDLLAFYALINGVESPRLYYDNEKGDIVFAGALAADAVFTDSLYAEQGDIAELTVDQLSTSRRIRKYNREDTSDDNYIFIHEQTIQFITGTTQGGQGIQATNRYGAGLYWAREPDSYTADGYPLDEDGAQIYATTTQTDWPIFHYEYTEQVKAQFTFEQLNNIYRPVLTLGAGDQNGNDKAKMAKEVGEFDLLYKTSSGAEIGMKCLLDGYMDLYGLRKTTNINFANWDNGTFTETVDGNVTNNYTVLFDAAGRPASITDAAGHVCTITWENGGNQNE